MRDLIGDFFTSFRFYFLCLIFERSNYTTLVLLTQYTRNVFTGVIVFGGSFKRIFTFKFILKYIFYFNITGKIATN